MRGTSYSLLRGKMLVCFRVQHPRCHCRCFRGPLASRCRRSMRGKTSLREHPAIFGVAEDPDVGRAIVVCGVPI